MGFFDYIGEAFGRDGGFTRFTEKIPVVGLITAGVQAAAGNGEHAKRALANQANACITTVGTVGGFMVGGPVGAVAGGALASTVGIAAEYGVSTTIDDAQVKGDTGDTSLKRFATDAVLGGAGGLIGGGGSGAVVKQVGMSFSKGTLVQMGGSAVKAAGGAFAGQAAQGLFDTVSQSGNQPQPKGPDTKDPPPKAPDLVRALSAAQAASGRKWIMIVRRLDQFKEGKFFGCKIDNPNLAPGSCIRNVTNNFANFPGLLHENIEWARAYAALEEYMTRVKSRLVGEGYEGKNLATALWEVISNTPESTLSEANMKTMRDTLLEYIADIEAQTAETRALFLGEVHMIERSQLMIPDPFEVDMTFIGVGPQGL